MLIINILVILVQDYLALQKINIKTLRKELKQEKVKLYIL